MSENPGLPQRQGRSEDEDKIADQEQVDEAHGPSVRGALGPGGLGDVGTWGRGDVGTWGLTQSPVPSPQFPLDYRKLTTSAARRLRRRVSSRLLSYFGRSSP